ncbi:MAG: ThiF family adenylyltransferase [Thaumarchaeota archaeon]|nr:ThiF family adenylyltransferase [Candidatus Calditenuaceae archaeon]MDW8187507.1 ThiF family adenylyltransferase [Nitrososphaerota archaeon]
MSSDDLGRYDRQMRIDGWDQELVMRSTVLVAGVGALGCEVAKNLTLAGVGRLILVDRDVVELSNLNRQMLFVEGDIGKPKAVVASERLRSLNPHVWVDAYHSDLRDLKEDVFASADVICSCLDSWGIRRWLNSVAVSLSKPLVDGAMEGLVGNVQVVLPYRTACLECHSTSLIPKEERLAECTLRKRVPEELRRELEEQGVHLPLEVVQRLFSHNIKTIYDIKYSNPREFNDPLVGSVLELLRDRLRPKLPALQSVSSVVAGIASTEVLKLIHRGAMGRAQKGLLVYDAKSCRFTRVPLRRSEECIVCGQNEVPPVLEVEPNSTVSNLREAIAQRFGFPDAEVLLGTRVLSDGELLADVLRDRRSALVYVISSRRHSPLPLQILMVQPAESKDPYSSTGQQA